MISNSVKNPKKTSKDLQRDLALAVQMLFLPQSDGGSLKWVEQQEDLYVNNC